VCTTQPCSKGSSSGSGKRISEAKFEIKEQIKGWVS
jgi:hypothetical protein